jgi:hypothetical protein
MIKKKKISGRQSWPQKINPFVLYRHRIFEWGLTASGHSIYNTAAAK